MTVSRALTTTGFGTGSSVGAVFPVRTSVGVHFAFQFRMLAPRGMGAAIATLAVFLPVYLFVIVPGRLLRRHGGHPRRQGFVKGATAAAVGAIAETGSRACERTDRKDDRRPANQMGAGTLDGEQLDMFYAAPDSADAVAAELISACGLRPIRVGGIEQAPLLDELFALWAALAFGSGRGRGIAFALRGA